MTSEKLKGKIKSFSEKSNLKAQEVLQMYFFERFLTRLEKSKYRANFIIKGGFLISSIIGIQNRTTMDYDIYMIFKLKNDKINVNNLKQAILETAKNRNSMEEILESKEILEDIKKYSPYPEKVKLVAVTKYSSVEDIEEFLETGQNICGENKVQVIKDKIEYFKEKNKKIKWHFIGNLQKNKVKYIIDDVDLIHSVNKLSLAQEINKKAEQSSKIMDVLLEINVYGEESKQGYSLDELKCDIIELQNLKNLNIIGVMTMAPFTDDEKILRMVFSELRKIRDELNKEYFNNNLTELSMGMSNDYKIALQEGSTFIRVGTKIFK